MGQTYRCEQCGNTYTKGWTDEEARTEYERNFPETQGDEEAVVCEDCYREIMKWWAKTVE